MGDAAGRDNNTAFLHGEHLVTDHVNKERNLFPIKGGELYYGVRALLFFNFAENHDALVAQRTGPILAQPRIIRQQKQTVLSG